MGGRGKGRGGRGGGRARSPAKVLCKFDIDCTRPDCYFAHPNGRLIDGDEMDEMDGLMDEEMGAPEEYGAERGSFSQPSRGAHRRRMPNVAAEGGIGKVSTRRRWG